MTEPSRMFDTVLVANRGEIALRIIRTCREMGIRSVIVHSATDRDSAAVRMADDAVQIGPSPAKRSYLYVPAVIEAALGSGAQAIHPGYGFLSEDPDFAEVCEKNGLVFVGPPPEVMAKLGDKIAARRLMAEAGLPILPGTAEPVHSDAEVIEAATRIGYPLIVKAAAGGGGNGMGIVRGPDDLLPVSRSTRLAAKAIFGDGRVYLERYWPQARHVEVQVLADQHGSILHLGERDCSVQRRHQKLIEETPAVGLPPGMADRLVGAATLGAAAAGYTSAGTFEFLLQGNEIAFIETNTRIQVEHPVTEMATGLDLVREQLRVAAGWPLSVRQEDVRPRGTAIECRVNAEDPDRDFTPTAGVLTEFVPPGGPFVRVDTHGFTGSSMPPDYDSLLAKVIVWAPDREQAIARMSRALEEFRIDGPGIRTTIPLLQRILREPEFRAGTHTTVTLDQWRTQSQ
jgi:acetyl-CoA carboxylase biotin carboxylase subunit